MTASLRPGGAGEVDELDLELALAGAVTDPDLLARIEAAKLGPLADTAAELAAAQAAWRRARPPLLPLSVSGAPSAVEARPGWGRRFAAAALLALAAGALGFALLPESTPSPSNPGLRAMGGPLAVQVERAGDASRPWAAGDRLAVSVQTRLASTISVASLQSDGLVTVLHAARAQPGERVRVPGGVELDAYGGREWLVVRAADAPATPEWFAGLLPEVREKCGLDCFAVEITRGGAP